MAPVFEEWLEETMKNSGSKALVIDSSLGLTVRTPTELELLEEHDHEEGEADEGHHHAEGDPHFWLDPNMSIQYVKNIRDGFIHVDPTGKDSYTTNAEQYIGKLTELDQWISEQVNQIPVERRLLVTNHESFGYYADRYGFKIIGAIVPSVTTGASPSAQELANLMDRIQEYNAPRPFSLKPGPIHNWLNKFLLNWILK